MYGVWVCGLAEVGVLPSCPAALLGHKARRHGHLKPVCALVCAMELSGRMAPTRGVVLLTYREEHSVCAQQAVELWFQEPRVWPLAAPPRGAAYEAGHRCATLHGLLARHAWHAVL